MKPFKYEFILFFLNYIKASGLENKIRMCKDRYCFEKLNKKSPITMRPLTFLKIKVNHPLLHVKEYSNVMKINNVSLNAKFIKCHFLIFFLIKACCCCIFIQHDNFPGIIPSIL